MSKVAIGVESDLMSISGTQHIYPATFADTGHNIVGLNKATGEFYAVQIDSVGSFANRIEAELAALGILPEIFTQVSENRKLSVHELPHRIYDAILRDSLLDKILWRASSIGGLLLASNPQNATALFQYAPLSLLLGGWDSQGGDAGNGTKLARAISCEIWGYNGRIANHCTQRIDPLKITRDAPKHCIIEGVLTAIDPVEKSTTDTEKKSTDVGKKPSELGHGDIPAKVDKGVFIEKIEMRGAISLTRLGRYHFPDQNGITTPERDQAARNVLVELAKLGISLVLDHLDLRSGCELYTTSRKCEMVYADGHKESITLNSDKKDLLNSLNIAKQHGLEFNDKPVELIAGSALAALADRSSSL